MYKFSYKRLFILIILCSFLGMNPTFAKRGGNGNGNSGGNGGGNSPSVPIDGGLSLLLAGGAALGIYFLKRKK